MKRIALIFSIVCLFSSINFAQIATPATSPEASVSQKIGLSKVTVNYSRTSLRGRKMIGGKQIPYGKVWRTGANKVTSIEFSEDVVIDKKDIAKGKYALVTIPDAKEWTVILNKKSEEWGTYNYKESEDVLRFKVKAVTLKQPVETLTFSFGNTQSSQANLQMAWENTQIAFLIQNKPDEIIMADIKAKTADPSKITNDTYYDAADYFLKTNQNLPQALEWATKLVEKDPQSWTYALQASIAAKMGDCKTAKEAATKGYALAEKENDAAEMAANKKVLDGCK